MPAEVTWSPQALLQLQLIHFTLGLRSLQRADRTYATLLRHTDLLRDFPQLGPARPDISANARMLVEKPYVILYEISFGTDNTSVSQVEVISVFDGRRNSRYIS